MFFKIINYIRKNTDFGKSRYLNFLFNYDFKRFFKYSSINCKKDVYAIITEIRIISHAIEKGLSLPNCKPGFGKSKIIEMISLYDMYKKSIDNIDPQINSIIKATIHSYVTFQKENGFDTSFIDSKYIMSRKDDYKFGIIHIPQKKSTDFAIIAKQRKSARYYEQGSISSEIIKKIIEIAQTAPSACNRQSIRVYACLNGEVIDKIMCMHKGVKGFGKPGVIFVITGDLRLYQNELERDTVFVDGGLFAMNMLYAIDSFGLVSCPAIWGNEPSKDIKMASIIGIPNNETIILLIISGKCPKDGYNSAISSKRCIDDILHII